MEKRRIGQYFGKLLALGLIMLSADSSAAGFEVGNILPGGAMIHKQVVSMRERRYLNLVEQGTDFSCGAAALATVLDFAYGKRLRESDVIDGLMKVSDVGAVRRMGFSLLDIKHYVESIGLRGRGYKIGPEMLDKIKIPVIVLLDLKGYKHFVVLSKITRDHAYLADPALGNRIIDRNQFVADWNGIVFAVIGPNYDRDTVLLSPSEPLTARSMVDVSRPLSDVELLDFGFVHADFM